MRGIIKNHGGAVSVESKLGVGTRIRVSFRASRRPVDKEPGPGEEPTPERGSGTLLVVDDDPDVRRVVASGLEMRGFRVITAEDGYRGVELFNEHRAEIHATVLDLTMPGGACDDSPGGPSGSGCPIQWVHGECRPCQPRP